MQEITAPHSIWHELREYLVLSTPLIATTFIYPTTSFVAVALIARLGNDALAASVIVGAIWLLITVFLQGFFNSVSILTAHQYGMQNYRKITTIVHHAFLIGALFCIPSMVVMLTAPYFFHFLSESVLTLTTTYIHALLWNIPAIIILTILSNFIIGIGKTKLLLVLCLLEVPLEIFFIYIFIFGKFSLPAFGIAGVGYGNALALTLTSIGLIIYLSRAHFMEPFQLFKKAPFESNYFKEIIHIGWPIGLKLIIEISAFAIGTFLLSQFGTLVLAAQQLVLQFASMTSSIAPAIGQAIYFRVGLQIGKKNLLKAKYVSYIGLLFNFLCMLIVCMIYILFPHTLLRLDFDIHNPANFSLLQMASLFFITVGIYQLVASLNSSGTSILIAFKDVRFPMFATLIGLLLVGFISAYLFGMIFNWGAIGVWVGFIVGLVVSTIFLWLRVRHIFRNADFDKLVQI